MPGQPRLHPLDQRRQLGDGGRRRHDVDHGLTGPPAVAEHEEAEQPLATCLLVGREPALDEEPPRLVEERVHPLRLDQASLDVEDRVVAVRLVEPDGDALAPAPRRDGELHLVAVAVGLLGAHDRPDLGAGEAADALEHVRHLLGLERELGRVGDVLEPAAAAAPEVRTGRCHAMGGRPSIASMTPRPKRERACSSRTCTRSPGTPPGTKTT